MKSIFKTAFLSALLLAPLMQACAGNPKTENNQTEKSMETKVLLETSLGNIVVKLYNETPQHRDNFVKLVNDGFYNGVLFHRVIADFMIQGGDPDSKTAKAGQQLGAGNIGYTVPAEFVFPKLYHKKGALAAARTGDAVNPQKASSGSQFYIVTGAVVDDAQLNQIEQSKQNGLGQSLFQKKVNENAALIQKMQSEGDQQGLQALQERFIQEIQQALAISPAFKFTPEQRETYKTIGGTPFLDNDYTVFGEVVEGMSVVDKISAVKTAPGDRPLEDVKVIKATVVK
jgi:peptidylprolyl isomerase